MTKTLFILFLAVHEYAGLHMFYFGNIMAVLKHKILLKILFGIGNRCRDLSVSFVYTPSKKPSKCSYPCDY